VHLIYYSDTRNRFRAGSFVKLSDEAKHPYARVDAIITFELFYPVFVLPAFVFSVWLISFYRLGFRDIRIYPGCPGVYPDIRMHIRICLYIKWIDDLHVHASVIGKWRYLSCSGSAADLFQTQWS
jgi:hypothetical protein